MSRQSRVTADVTLEAHNLLRDYCKKHERSKGFLLEKMIRKFCAVDKEVELARDRLNNSVVTIKPKATVKRFTPPTVEQVREYCDSRCNNVDPQNFVDHYTGNGWIRGKTKVKCWKACVRTWENKDKPVTVEKTSLKGKW